MDSTSVQSRIFPGWVVHSRSYPVNHSFKYPVFYYCFDLDELSSRLVEQQLYPLFSYYPSNTKPNWMHAPISISEDDYLGKIEGKQTIREKLYYHLNQRNIATDNIGRVEMITVAELFGYVFNPVNFYYCYSKDAITVNCIVTEINNTFGETHIYVLDNNNPTPSARKNNLTHEESKYHHSRSREFHVSPFNDVDGDYDFAFSDIQQSMRIRINISKQSSSTFYAVLWSKEALPLTRQNLLKTVLVDFPLGCLWTSPRIIYQAAILHWKKKLPVYVKPNPLNNNTIVCIAPTKEEQQAMDRFFSDFSKIVGGIVQPHTIDKDDHCVSFHLPNQDVKQIPLAQSNIGDLSDNSQKHPGFLVKVKNYSFFTELVSNHYHPTVFMKLYMDQSFHCLQNEGLTQFISWIHGLHMGLALVPSTNANYSSGKEDQVASSNHDMSQMTISYEFMTYMIKKMNISYDSNVLIIGNGHLAIDLVKAVNCSITVIVTSIIAQSLLNDAINKQLPLQHERVEIIMTNTNDYSSIKSSSHYTHIITTEPFLELETNSPGKINEFLQWCSNNIKPSSSQHPSILLQTTLPTTTQPNHQEAVKTSSMFGQMKNDVMNWIEQRYFATITNYVVSPYTKDQRFQQITRNLPEIYNIFKNTANSSHISKEILYNAINSTEGLSLESIEPVSSEAIMKTVANSCCRNSSVNNRNSNGNYDELSEKFLLEEERRVRQFYCCFIESQFNNKHPFVQFENVFMRVQ